MRIAFFDSGIGGLSVLRQALLSMPTHQYIYYADTRNAPYGKKTGAEVRACVMSAVEFLAGLGLDALVIACNTATSVAIKELRARFGFPIIGMEPAVKPALTGNQGKKVLVCATSLTLQEEKLENLIKNLNGRHKVALIALDALVTFAERFEFDTPPVNDYLMGQFAHLDWHEYETAVLGCTHFIFYRLQIERLSDGRVKVLDGNVGTIKQLMRTLKLAPPTIVPSTPAIKDTPEIIFYTSGLVESEPRRQRMLQLLQTESGTVLC